jgi:hypothetical protein
MWWGKKRAQAMSIAEIGNRLRGFVYDSQLQEAQALSIILGCPVISDEVAEREEEESHKRLETIGYLVPLMYAHAHALAEAATEYQRTTMPEAKELPDEVWQFSRRMIEQISLSTLLGSVSQLVDMGLLEVPRRLR